MSNVQRIPIEIELSPEEVDALVALLEAGGRHLGIASFGDVAHFVARLREGNQSQPTRNELRAKEAEISKAKDEIIEKLQAQVAALEEAASKRLSLVEDDDDAPDPVALQEIAAVARQAMLEGAEG